MLKFEEKLSSFARPDSPFDALRLLRAGWNYRNDGSSNYKNMIRDWYKALVLVMWVALPWNALEYWRAWDQLPARMAVHFDANWRPNGYTSKEGAVMLGLGIMATMLVIFTVTMPVARGAKPSASWPVLIISYFVLGVIWYGNSSIIDFNLKAQSAQSELVESDSTVELRSTDSRGRLSLQKTTGLVSTKVSGCSS